MKNFKVWLYVKACQVSYVIYQIGASVGIR